MMKYNVIGVSYHSYHLNMVISGSDCFFVTLRDNIIHNCFRFLTDLFSWYHGLCYYTNVRGVYYYQNSNI